MMGCGKSFWGKHLATKLNYNFIDLDDVIETQTALPIAKMFEQNGEAYFRQIEHQTLLKIIQQNTQPTIVATGGGTPCFYNAIEIMNKVGITIFLNQSIDTIVEQIKLQNKPRPVLKNSTHFNVKNHIKTLFKQRIDCYNKSKYCVASIYINETELLKIILQNV